MDQNVLIELENSLRNLNDTITAFSGSMAKFSNSIKKSTSAIADSRNELNRNTGNVDKNQNGSTAIQNSQKEADRIIKESTANLNDALKSGLGTVRDFNQAVFSSEEGMAKYGKVSAGIGFTLGSLTKSFGLLGGILGGLLGALGLAVAESLKVDDNIVKFRDGFTKMSGILPTTTTNLGDLAKQSRFSLDDMQKLAKRTSSLGTALTSLGGYAGEGAVKFMEMANVTDAQRRKYDRLGISQEELLDGQAKYLEMMSASGQASANQRKSVSQLRKESLEYVDNLNRMSSLTGKSKQDLEKEREAAMLEYEEQVQLAAENEQIRNLRASGRDKEADAIQLEQDNRRKLITTYTDLYGKEQGMLVGRVMRQHGYDEKTAALKIRGDDILGLSERLRTSTNAQAEINKNAEKTDEAFRDMAERANTTVQVAGKEFGERVGLEQEAARRVAERSGMSITKALEKIDKDTEKKGKEGTDPLADEIAGIHSFERESKAKLQTFLESIDPLRNGFEMLKNAAYATMGVIAVITAGKLFSGIRGFFKRGKSVKSVKGAVSRGTRRGIAGRALGMIPGGEKVSEGIAAAEGAAGGLLGDQAEKAAGAIHQGEETDSKGGLISALKEAGRAAPQVIAGGAALGLGLAGLGAGLAGAVWLLGKALPTFAEGIESFNKIKGKNLILVGAGMAGLGVGVLAMGAGTIAQAIGNIGKFFTGGQDPLEQAVEMLTKLQDAELDRKRIENNGMALMSFALTMTALAGLGAIGNIAKAISAVSNAVSGFFSTQKLPYEELQDFAKLRIDEKQVTKNAKAMTEFSNAVASFTGYGSNIGAAGQAMAQAATGFFQTTPPTQQMIEFGELKVNSEKVKKNSISFTWFAEALASFKGYGSPIGVIGTALAQASFKFFHVKPPLAQAVHFSHLDIDPKKTKINADSFVLFSHAMASYKGGQGLLSAVSTIAGAKLNSLFGQDSPIDAYYNFSKKDFGPNAEKNAKAFLNFSRAMGILSGGSGGALSTIANAAGELGGAVVGTITGAAQAVGELFTGGSVGDAGTQQGNDVKIGNQIRRGGTVSWRTNNPGNVSYGALAKQYGAVGRWMKLDGDKQQRTVGIAIMPTQEHGWKLKMGLWRRPMYLDLDVDHGVSMWTRGNPTANLGTEYAKDMARAGGVPLTTKIRDLSDSQLRAMVQKQQKWEGWKEGQVLQARKGGLFTGPTGGYPMELHGTEMVIPQMSQNSLLMKLAQANSDVSSMGAVMEMLHSVAGETAPMMQNPGSAMEGVEFLNPEMISVLSTKFDTVLDILGESDDVHSKILQHSSV